MDFRHLRAFVAVAEELSFSKAAQRLHISQPPLSRQIQQLEREIGVRLFVRHAHGVELTHKGRALLEDAKRLNAAAAEFANAARHATGKDSGVVRIGIGWGLLEAVIRIRCHFAASFPGTDIIGEDLCVPRVANAVVDAFKHHRIDVAIVRTPVELDDIQSTRLFDERMTVLIRDDHPLARSRSVRLADVAAEPLLLFDRQLAPSVYDKTLALYGAAGITPRIKCTPHAPVTLAGMMLVVSGQGIYFGVSSPYTQPHSATGIVEIPLDEPDPTIPVSLVWRKSERRPGVLRLVESVREVFSSERLRHTRHGSARTSMDAPRQNRRVHRSGL